MFRYLAFSWQPDSEAQARYAAKLAASICTAGQWQPAFVSERLHVYTTGCSAGINEIYPLPSGRGVVLGRLFRMHDRSLPGERSLEIDEHEDARIINSAGRALIQEFWGRWIAFLPSGTQEHRVARDPSGALPCFQWEVGGVALVFSWLEDALQLLQAPAPEVDWDAVRAALVFRRIGGHETALKGVTQVLAGELAAIPATRHPPTVLWSAAAFARTRVEPEHRLAAQMLRETTTQCVRAWMGCYDDIVLRLSGGVDSAILLGSLFIAPPTARIVCLNYYSPGHDSDERAYARSVAARACCRLLERHRDDDFQLKEVLRPARTPMPGNHIGRLGSDRMDAEAADAVGAPVLFTGAGGDQLFQEVRSTWPAADYLQLHGPDRGFPRAVLDAARLGHVSFWRALQLAFKHRMTKHDPLAGIGQSVALIPSDVVTDALRQADRYVHPGLMSASDLPIGKLAHLNALICPFDYYNPYAPESSPELVHPLMSQPLLELCLSLPTFVLTRGGHGRALAREAFADRIPSEVANRRSKGGTESHVAAVLQRSLPLARSILLDGQLVRRGLLDRDQVESALAGRPSTKGAYVTEVHVCFAIEAWLHQVSSGVQSARI